MRQLLMGTATLLSVALFSGCGGSNTPSPPAVGGGGINGCTSFTDATAATASRTVNFGGSLANSYSPKCLAISAGQSVTFAPMGNSSFTAHPLRKGVGPTQTGSDPESANNPIQSVSSTSTPVQVTFTAAGTYGYYCSAHETLGMVGAIQVR
jgi:plastocyanin